MFIFLITYRAHGVQQFRRKELIDMLENIKTYFTPLKNSIRTADDSSTVLPDTDLDGAPRRGADSNLHWYNMKSNDIGEYKILICEQNNDMLFNKGILYNAGFLEAEKIFNKCIDRRYFMINVDYRFNMDHVFPKDYLKSKIGFIDIYLVDKNAYNFIGGCSCVDPYTYKLLNGYPNDIYGWGGEDWALMRRIREKGVLYDRSILNNGLIIDNSGWAIHNAETTVDNDYDTNQRNMRKALQDPIENNGLDNCHYKVDGYGEFHNGDVIHHIMVSF